MTITIDSNLEAYLREHAEASGLTVDAYIERLISADRNDEMDSLESIHHGIADVAAGLVTPLKEFETEFRANAGLPSRSR